MKNLESIKVGSRELTAEEIIKYLLILNEKLKQNNKHGELSMVGGAVMCLVFESRLSTFDIDAIFSPHGEIEKLIFDIADEYKLPKHWINEGVAMYLSKKGEFSEYRNLSNLKIYVATPEYMLAMKALSARIGNINELKDIKFLINYLDLKSSDDVFKVIGKFYSLDEFKVRFYLILKEIFSE